MRHLQFIYEGKEYDIDTDYFRLDAEKLVVDELEFETKKTENLEITSRA